MLAIPIHKFFNNMKFNKYLMNTDLLWIHILYSTDTDPTRSSYPFQNYPRLLCSQKQPPELNPLVWIS